MTPKQMIEKLDALHAAGNFHGLTIWPSKGGYQISLATTASNSWRIRSAATPGAGLAEILGVDDLNHDGKPMPWPCTLTRTASEPAMVAPPDVDEPELPFDEPIPEDNCACGGGDFSGHAAGCPEERGDTAGFKSVIEGAGIFD